MHVIDVELCPNAKSVERCLEDEALLE